MRLILFIVSGMLLLSSGVNATEIALVCDFEKLEFQNSTGQIITEDRSKAGDFYKKKETINFDLNKKKVIDTTFFIINNSSFGGTGYKLNKITEIDSNQIGFRGKDEDENKEIIVIIDRITGSLRVSNSKIEKNGKLTQRFTRYYNCKTQQKLF